MKGLSGLATAALAGVALAGPIEKRSKGKRAQFHYVLEEGWYDTTVNGVVTTVSYLTTFNVPASTPTAVPYSPPGSGTGAGAGAGSGSGAGSSGSGAGSSGSGSGSGSGSSGSGGSGSSSPGSGGAGSGSSGSGSNGGAAGNPGSSSPGGSGVSPVGSGNGGSNAGNPGSSNPGGNGVSPVGSGGNSQSSAPFSNSTASLTSFSGSASATQTGSSSSSASSSIPGLLTTTITDFEGLTITTTITAAAPSSTGLGGAEVDPILTETLPDGEVITLYTTFTPGVTPTPVSSANVSSSAISSSSDNGTAIASDTLTSSTASSTAFTSQTSLLTAPVTGTPLQVTSTDGMTYSTPSPISTTAPQQLLQPTDYNDIVVLHHNVHRANHSAPDISWDQNLADIALSIAQTCVYQHNTTAGGGGYGQNIAAGVDPNGISYVITQLFYNGEVNNFNQYGVANPDFSTFHSWGHFSQVVWKASTRVGCATNYCSQGLTNAAGIQPWFTVCNYQAIGNFGGEYANNIGSPLGFPTVYANYGIENYDDDL